LPPPAEWAENGSLWDILRSNKAGLVTPAVAVRWATDAARGMQYLHSRSLLHRDLKSKNLLVDMARSR
jgi:serine/threonine protein kinase